MKDLLLNFLLLLANINLATLALFLTLCFCIFLCKTLYLVYNNLYNKLFYCVISTDIAISNDGVNFNRNLCAAQKEDTVFVKYEIAAKTDWFHTREIHFKIKKSESPGIVVSLQQSNNNNNGIIKKETPCLNVLAARQKSKPVTIVLKCERGNYNNNDDYLCFKLNFFDKNLNKIYARSFTLQFLSM